MIDVERLQRLNQLTNELMQHGIVTDREQAMRQANMMINKAGDRAMFNGTSPQQQVSIQPMQSAPPPYEGQTMQADGHAVAPQMMQNPPDAQAAGGYVPDWSTLYRRLELKINEQNTTITFLSNQLKQVQSELSDVRKAPRQVIVERPAPMQEAPSPAQAPQMSAAPTARGGEHKQPQVIDANTGRPVAFEQMGERKSPRTGGYTPADVSIEKFFYAASKGK